VQRRHGPHCVQWLGIASDPVPAMLYMPQSVCQAFKTETVGLVTKAEFMHKRATLKERLEEEQRRSAKAATQAAQQVGGALCCTCRRSASDATSCWAASIRMHVRAKICS